MKKCNPVFRILVCFLFCTSFLFFSCSDDTPQNEGQADAGVASTLRAKGIETLPANPANTYDYVGKLHNELLYTYYQSRRQPNDFASVMERLDSLAWNHLNFIRLAADGYSVPDTVKINSILERQITVATDVIALSKLSVSAKSSLSTFISSIYAFSTTEDDYEVIYSYLVAYESDVLHNVSYSITDKAVLLSLSSIARHSAYAKKKRPKKNMDPDWDVLVSNIIASTEGASESLATAVMYGLLAGIVENGE